jgi:trk system potassium uptake protein TrkH
VSSLHPILQIGGLLLFALAASMTLPAVTDLAVGNPDWQIFLASAGVTGFVGASLALGFQQRDAVTLDLRQAFLLTCSSWVGLAAFSALPFMFLDQRLDYADAFFESISGLTTTGSTILVGLDQMPPGMLLWRSLLQWIGGIGIILTAIIILPFLRVGGMQLFRAESSERSEKVVARPYELMSLIGLIYTGLTILCAVGFWAGGMSAFDAVCHAMTALSTGGYSTHDASFGAYKRPAILIVATVFMVLGSLPFVAYIRTWQGKGMAIWQDSQVITLLGILVSVSAVIGIWIAEVDHIPLLDSLILAAFHVTSIVTTTGFASTDYQLWGALPIGILFFLTFVGGCTGSTAGGIKIFRFQVLWLVTRAHLRRLLRPHIVVVPTYHGRLLDDDIATSVLAFIFVYMLIVALTAAGLAAFGLDLVTSLSAAATAVSNVGPGFGPIVGPAGNFAPLPDGAKWVLSLAMLLGRLELFTVFVLFSRSFWRG